MKEEERGKEKKIGLYAERGWMGVFIVEGGTGIRSQVGMRAGEMFLPAAAFSPGNQHLGWNSRLAIVVGKAPGGGLEEYAKFWLGRVRWCAP